MGGLNVSLFSVFCKMIVSIIGVSKSFTFKNAKARMTSSNHLLQILR